MTTPPTLQAIRERVNTHSGLVLEEISDRRHLLNLVERMRAYVKRTSHPFDCSASQGSPRDCTCGLDALLKELST